LESGAGDAANDSGVLPLDSCGSQRNCAASRRDLDQLADGARLSALGLFDRTKAPAPGDSAISGQIKDFNAKIDATPVFFTMLSEDNQRATQVQAGRAYMRAQLAATAQGLSMHPLQQALQEYPEQAALYRRIHSLAGASAPGQTVQMWTRVGYAAAVSPAPRRGLEAHIKSA
jgi:hypothetical protein